MEREYELTKTHGWPLLSSEIRIQLAALEPADTPYVRGMITRIMNQLQNPYRLKNIQSARKSFEVLKNHLKKSNCFHS